MSKWDDRKTYHADSAPVDLHESPFSYAFFFPSDFDAFHRTLLDPHHRTPRVVDLADVARFCEDFVLLDYVGLTHRTLDYIAPYLVDFYDDDEDLPIVNIEEEVGGALMVLVDRIDSGVRQSTPDRRFSDALTSIVASSIKLDCFGYDGPATVSAQTHRAIALKALRMAFREDIAAMRDWVQAEHVRLGSELAVVNEETSRAIASAKTEADLLRVLPLMNANDVSLRERRNDLTACAFLFRNFYEIEASEDGAIHEAIGTLRQLQLTNSPDELERVALDVERLPEEAEVLAVATRKAGVSVSPSAAAAPIFDRECKAGQEARLLYECVANAAQNDAEMLARWDRSAVLHVPPILQALTRRSTSKDGLLRSLVELRDEYSTVRQELYELRAEVREASSRDAKLRAINVAEAARIALMQQIGGGETGSVVKRVWSLATVNSVSSAITAVADIAVSLGKGNVLVSSIRHFQNLYALTREVDHAAVRAIFGEVDC